jgi:hypothetical protein
MRHESMGDLHLIGGGDTNDLLDLPRRVHHGNFAGFCRADEVDKILHRTQFNLFEVKLIVHLGNELRSQ